MFRRPPEIQKHIYFLVQKLRGEPVKEAWKEIKSIDHSDRNALRKRIVDRGVSHLNYILNNVPKYMALKNRGRIISLLKKVSTVEEFDDLLKGFPITHKREIIENPENLTSREIDSIPVFGTHSSGTTGQSVRFPKDMRDWARSHANMFYILSLYGINPFSPYIYYWAGDWSIKSRLEYLKKDIVLNRLRITSYNTSKWYLLRQYRKILKFRPEYIYGIPSGITTLASYMLNNGLKPPSKIRGVFTTGEMLYPYQRKIISSAFNVPVVNIYGTAEVGVIAFDCPHGHLHVMTDTNYMEVIDGGTILITNFFQKAFSIVRYRIGDIAASVLEWQHSCNLSYPTISGISGRESDRITLPHGKTLPPMAPTYIFDKIAHTRSVIKFRYELYKDELILKLVVNSRFNERVKKLIISESERLFGIRPFIKIVESIPPLKGGKERYFVVMDKNHEA